MKYTSNLDLRNVIKIDDFIIKLKEMIDIVYSSNNTSNQNTSLYYKRGMIYSIINEMNPFRVGHYNIDYNLNELSKNIYNKYGNPYFLIYTDTINDIIFNKKNLYNYYANFKKIIIYFATMMDKKFLYDLKFIEIYYDLHKHNIRYYNRILGIMIADVYKKHYYSDDKYKRCKNNNECIFYLIDDYI